MTGFFDGRERRHGRAGRAVLLCCLLATVVFATDAAWGEGSLGLAGLTLMVSALALTLTLALWARVGRPWRMTRRAAATARAASVFVAAFLASVGVLERMGPDVTSSAAFGAGVAASSGILLVVLPLALVAFGWGVFQDRRLSRWMRVLPWALVLVIALTGVAVTATSGSDESWWQAAGVVVVGALLTGFSAGLERRVAPSGSDGSR